MTIASELRHLKAVQIFDLEDIYAREWAVRGRHPRPIGPIKFYVVGQVVNGSRQDFHEPLELVVRRNPSGYHLFFGVVRLPNGAKRRSYLADGKYIVRVEGRYYQQFEKDVTLPIPNANKPAFFDLFPAYLYPFPKTRGGRPTLLRGCVQRPDGQGIAKVKVQIVGQEKITSMTSETGRWLLIFPDDQPAGNVTVRFTLDETSKDVDDVAIEPGPENSLEPVVFSE